MHIITKPKKVYLILSQGKSLIKRFDACSQQLLSLYHSLPNLKYPSFERYSNNFNIETAQYQSIINHPRHTYDSLVNTFNAIQLLTQTLSNTGHAIYEFIPITQHRTVQNKLNNYIKITDEDLKSRFIEELTNLFHTLSEKTIMFISITIYKVLKKACTLDNK